MPLIKKKISELPLADSLKGLYTIGYKIIDGIKTSVKVSLEDIQTAYQDVVNAIKKSEEATRNANNAAVTANEKSSLANTAALNAEKVANNPTYIGKDHYVYVYNKDTESFDKTDIYCKGEPGSSFRVAGEYATLEALKSAVPDGSAVDGFMAVGTEAPYDYYAWVNGEWVSQGKIGGIDEAPTDGKAYGRKNGGWAEVPEHLNLTSENLNDINGAGFATQKSTADYTSPENNYPINENGALIFANANYGRSNQIYGSYLTNRWFARGGGNQHGVRTNWKEFAFTDDVLTKTNTSSFTPTGDYQPATKKYVDDINYGKVINVSVGTYLVTNKNEKDREAIDLINTIFGSVDNLKEIIQDIIANHTKYYFHSYNSKDNCIELSSIYSFHNPETEEYNLQCNISYYTNNGPVSKRMGFKLMPNDEDCAASIEDILTSDNLAFITQMTSSEYESLPDKKANTIYVIIN